MRNSTAGFVILTLLLILVTGFSVVGTVRGQEDTLAIEEEHFYRKQEEILLEDTREALKQLGFSNSGVTLNRVVDAEGDRTYTFTIHHSRIDSMTDSGRRELASRLETLTEEFPVAVPGGKCTFLYEFLIL